jgi:orotidine-5'-phosphate decarboxylase
MPPRIKRELSEVDLPRYLSEYLRQKVIADQLAAKVADMKATMMAYVEANGYEDDKGHQWVDIEGVEGVSQLKRERRASTFLDEEVAAQEMAKLGMLKKCTKIVREFDEDKMLALAYDGEIPRTVVDKCYVEKTSYAFKPVA